MSVWEGSGNVQALDVLRAVGARRRDARRRCSPSCAWRAAPTGGSTRRSHALSLDAPSTRPARGA